MTIRWMAAAALVAAGFVPQDTAVAGKAKVEIVGLHINKAPFKGDTDFAPNMEPAPGTMVSVVATIDDGGIIKLESGKSRLTKFTDDKGTDLRAAKPPKDSFNTSPIGEFSKISKDQKAILVDLRAMTVPAVGATTIQVEASLSLVVGKEPAVLKGEPVEAKKDVKFKAGDLGFTITEAGKSDFGDDPMKVALESKDGLKIAKFRFLDADGKEIESRRGSYGSMSFGGDATYSWEFSLKRMVSSFTLEVTAWKSVTTVDVPVRLSVSAGF